MKITILEYANEMGEWVYFGAYKTTQVKNVIEQYLAEHDITDPIIEGDTGYIVPDVCRAWVDELNEL
jgi:hypothetical protein